MGAFVTYTVKTYSFQSHFKEVWRPEVNSTIGDPMNPQQPKGEPLPSVVKLLIFCFEGLWTFVLRAATTCDVPRAIPVHSIKWQFHRYILTGMILTGSQSLSQISRQLLSLYCLWQVEAEDRSMFGRSCTFLCGWLVSSHCHFDEWPGHMISWSWIGSGSNFHKDSVWNASRISFMINALFVNCLPFSNGI